MTKVTGLQFLIGKTVKDVRTQTPIEMEEFGWYEPAIVIVFNDGEEIIIASDDEGNAPGTIFF